MIVPQSNIVVVNNTMVVNNNLFCICCRCDAGQFYFSLPVGVLLLGGSGEIKETGIECDEALFPDFVRP